LQIEGYAKGFTTKDIELAATSSLIEKTLELELNLVLVKNMIEGFTFI